MEGYRELGEVVGFRLEEVQLAERGVVVGLEEAERLGGDGERAEGDLWVVMRVAVILNDVTGRSDTQVRSSFVPTWWLRRGNRNKIRVTLEHYRFIFGS